MILVYKTLKKLIKTLNIFHRPNNYLGEISFNAKREKAPIYILGKISPMPFPRRPTSQLIKEYTSFSSADICDIISGDEK